MMRRVACALTVQQQDRGVTTGGESLVSPGGTPVAGHHLWPGAVRDHRGRAYRIENSGRIGDGSGPSEDRAEHRRRVCIAPVSLALAAGHPCRRSGARSAVTSVNVTVFEFRPPLPNGYAIEFAVESKRYYYPFSSPDKDLPTPDKSTVATATPSVIKPDHDGACKHLLA
jgi:hypothetical protein